ncbi:MAG: SRPBCC family protein [Acidimicrobiales bacterium]
MDLVAELEAPVPPAVLFPWVDDLDRYPQWLEIVTRAQSAGPEAWLVDLRGRLGPLARSKRLRMARTVRQPPRAVVFERRETDGRTHAPWRLTASVEPLGDGSRLVMRLHYGGGLWGPVIERLLGDEIERSRPRLLELLADEAGPLH